MIDGFSEILAKQIVEGLNDFMKFWNELPVEFRHKLRQEVEVKNFDKSVVLSGFRSKELEERLKPSIPLKQTFIYIKKSLKIYLTQFLLEIFIMY